jgi:hypothetical protein
MWALVSYNGAFKEDKITLTSMVSEDFESMPLLRIKQQK